VACEEAPVEIFYFLLHSGKINIDAQDCGGSTVLHLAVRRNIWELLGRLLGENPNTELEDHRRLRPLHYALDFAIKSKDPKTVDLLLQNGTSIRSIKMDKWRSLYDASDAGILIRENEEKNYIMKESLPENALRRSILREAFEGRNRYL